MKRNIKDIVVVGLTALVVMGCLGGCGGSSSVASTETVTTHRITRKTTGAIKAEETSVIAFENSDRKLKLTEDYRYAMGYDDATEITTYYIWNPQIANANADAKDGRAEGEYEKELKVAFENAREQAIKEASKWNPFKKKEDKESQLTDLEDDVFVFDKDAYITAYHDDIMMYVYSGIDRTSPTGMLQSSQVKSSALTYYQSSIVAGIPSMKNALWDTGCCPSYTTLDIDTMAYEKDDTNGDFFSLTFTGNSGDYASTTYGTQVYPKTYYGIYLIEKNVKDGSLRRWYCFVFANDSVGNIVDEKLYKSVFEQFRSEFGVFQFFTMFDKDNWAYDPETDYSKGKSYVQLEKAFEDTRNYYIMRDNRKQNETMATDDTVTSLEIGVDDEESTDTIE